MAGCDFIERREKKIAFTSIGSILISITFCQISKWITSENGGKKGRKKKREKNNEDMKKKTILKLYRRERTLWTCVANSEGVDEVLMNGCMSTVCVKIFCNKTGKQLRIYLNKNNIK